MRLPKNKQTGFTLIELLIVIAIVGILAVAAFVALDPGTRFKDARDAQRWTDVSAILDAIVVDQLDNDGPYLTAIENLSDGSNYMITTGSSGCDDTTCDVTVVADDACVDLSGLATEGYLAEVPVSPNGDQTWTSSTESGYVINKSSTGAITITACESENTTSISVRR